MLDELLLGGEIQETSKKNVLKAIAAQDLLQEVISYFCFFRNVSNTRDHQFKMSAFLSGGGRGVLVKNWTNLTTDGSKKLPTAG